MWNGWFFLWDNDSFHRGTIIYRHAASRETTTSVQVSSPGHDSWVMKSSRSLPKLQSNTHTLCMCNQASTQKKMQVMNTKVAKCGAQTQIDRRRISYRDSGNYSTSSIGRQLSHLLLLLLPPVPSIICSPDNKKQQRENPKQTAENRHLTVCICDRRGTCVSVCV